MAKPIIGFKGVKYKAGAVEGYRPQLETATKVTDLALAEEICIERRLSLSPEELLFAVKTTLETAPALVAADGRVRQFNNLLCFNRSASGKLDGPGSAWNETCKANVKVQLLKNTKATVDATFRNVLELPTPKLDNVTYPGAQTVVNVVKVGQQIIAYGRNMQMGEGDYARLIVVNPYEMMPLALVSSDAAHAVFAWPGGFSPEAGTEVRFYMYSSGGVAGAGRTENMKKVITLAADVPTMTLTDFTQEGEANPWTVFMMADAEESGVTYLRGTGFDFNAARGDRVELRRYDGGVVALTADQTSRVTASTATQITLSGIGPAPTQIAGDWWNGYPDTKVALVQNGVTVEAPIHIHGIG